MTTMKCFVISILIYGVFIEMEGNEFTEYITCIIHDECDFECTPNHEAIYLNGIWNNHFATFPPFTHKHSHNSCTRNAQNLAFASTCGFPLEAEKSGPLDIHTIVRLRSDAYGACNIGLCNTSTLKHHFKAQVSRLYSWLWALFTMRPSLTINLPLHLSWYFSNKTHHTKFIIVLNRSQLTSHTTMTECSDGPFKIQQSASSGGVTNKRCRQFWLLNLQSPCGLITLLLSCRQ